MQSATALKAATLGSAIRYTLGSGQLMGKAFAAPLATRTCGRRTLIGP